MKIYIAWLYGQPSLASISRPLVKIDDQKVDTVATNHEKRARAIDNSKNMQEI